MCRTWWSVLTKNIDAAHANVWFLCGFAVNLDFAKDEDGWRSLKLMRNRQSIHVPCIHGCTLKSSKLF